MKTRLALAALCLSATVPLCSAQDSLPAVPVPAVDKQIDLPANYRKMWPDEFAPYLRAYDLSNGQTLVVYNRGSMVYAALDGAHPHTLVALSANTFVATDRALKLHVDLDERDQASGYVLIAVPAQRMADGRLQPARLLQIALG